VIFAWVQVVVFALVLVEVIDYALEMVADFVVYFHERDYFLSLETVERAAEGHAMLFPQRVAAATRIDPQLIDIRSFFAHIWKYQRLLLEQKQSVSINSASRRSAHRLWPAGACDFAMMIEG
jgi:hypothetical protein